MVSSQYGKNRSSALPSSLTKPMPETLTSCIAPGRSVCSNARRYRSTSGANRSGCPPMIA